MLINTEQSRKEADIFLDNYGDAMSMMDKALRERGIKKKMRENMLDYADNMMLTMLYTNCNIIGTVVFCIALAGMPN